MLSVNKNEMSFRLIIFIIIQLAALIFFVEMLRRVSKRANEYSLTESKHSLPFGFLKLRHVVFMYIVSYVVWVFISLAIFMVFINTQSPYYLGSESAPSQVQMKLNL